MHNPKRRKVFRRPWIGRAQLHCSYCGYRTWLVVSRTACPNPWKSKPPWLSLGACCCDATLQVTRGVREPLLHAHYDAPTDELSVSQLRRRQRSRALPGAARDPRHKDPRRLAAYHKSRDHEKRQRQREIIQVMTMLPAVRIHPTPPQR
jgi:hypothetical protein